MGFTTRSTIHPHELKQIGSTRFREPNSVAFSALDRNGDYVFLQEVDCFLGAYTRSFGDESWVRYEFEIDRPVFGKWKPDKEYKFGQFVRYEKKNWQARIKCCSKKFDVENWRVINARPMLVLCNRPRQSQEDIFLSRFRVGVKDKLSTARRQHAIARKEKFGLSLPKDLTDGQFEKAIRSDFIEWFEGQNRDWSYGDDKKLRAGFSFVDSLKEARRDLAGLIFGMTMPSQKISWKGPTKTEHIDDAIEQVWRSIEITAELQMAWSSCDALLPSDMKNRYVFWPKRFVDAARARNGKFNESVLTLFDEQRDMLDETMKLSIQQAFAGPEDSDVSENNPDFWIGKRVSKLAIAIFRSRLYSQWRKLVKDAPQGGRLSMVRESDFLGERSSDTSIGYADYDFGE